ncbi:iron-containing alcohol dehydrogenase family protein [Tuberibacillus sp. Marseille-P3662]|uniref:iron-containing alcohol dehydrogenase family protein n=1 Tax=Tuberibacillus sp. Marseille-P3662 TaxID=1965358 RepID=UPI000A1CAD9D|nr:iron-containing alcohol dehydrogenase family protein [Tuberibacillus sp. Marseille-P3662]
MGLQNQPFNLGIQADLKFGLNIVQQELANSVKQVNGKKVFIVTDKGLIDSGVVDNVTNPLAEAGIDYYVFSDVQPNPTADSVMAGVEMYEKEAADMIVMIGGGSAIDFAKALAVGATHSGFVLDYTAGRKPIEDKLPPLFAIPTTIGTGSEVTRVSVITDAEAGRKLVLVSPNIIPKTVFVDPTLTLGLPRQHVAATGSDTLVHAIEAYVSLPANPFTDGIALQAIRMVMDHLPQTYAHAANVEARAQVHLASTLAGMAFSLSGLGLVHSLSHPMSARYGVPHGLANAIILPSILDHNLPANPKKYADVARMFDPKLVLESESKAAGSLMPLVRDFLSSLDIPESFSYLGVDFTEDKVEQLAEDAMNDTTALTNPRKAVKDDIIKIYNKVLPESIS